jgi:hypothetical protein
MYYVYNNILRDIESGEVAATANQYLTTIQLIVSGIRKLSTMARCPRALPCFAGYGTRAATRVLRDEQGCAGGVEASFMSTTLSEEVARQYISVNDGREATIFRLQLAKILKSQNIVP